MTGRGGGGGCGVWCGAEGKKKKWSTNDAEVELNQRRAEIVET